VNPRREFLGTPSEAAKGKNTHGSLDAENVPSLAAVSISWILRAEGWTGVGIFESSVLRGARRTRRTAHPITRSLSDAASNFASLPALCSTEAAFCRLRAPRSFYSDFSSSASASRVSSSAAFSRSSLFLLLVISNFRESSFAAGCVASWICFSLRIVTCV